jgi:hypothetical protein
VRTDRHALPYGGYITLESGNNRGAAEWKPDNGHQDSLPDSGA